MASIKSLKKQINYNLGDIIGECYDIKATNTKGDSSIREAIVDEAITVFDSLIEKVNAKGVESKKAHFKSITAELKSSVDALQKKVQAL